MKKFLASVLSMIFILVFISSCNRSPENPSKKENLPVLKVLIDLTIAEDGDSSRSQIERFLESHAAGCGTDYQIEVEALPPISDPDKRNPVLTGKHMELLAGGADVFLVRNYSDSAGIYADLKNFFPYPGSAMRQNLFLPLDDYIKDDADWSQLLPSVVRAGSLNGSQQIVPLGFGIKTSLIDRAKYEPSEALPMSADQMLASDDLVLSWAATCNIPELLGMLIDYETEELTFREEELLALVKKVKKAQERAVELDVRQLGGIPSVSIGPLNEHVFHSEEGTEYYMIPSYNRDGGVTAYIETYAAINRNTKYPDEAYAILKAFWSLEGQRNDLITCLKLPVYRALGQKKEPGAQNWFLDDWEYEQLAALQEQINAVDFVTPLTGELETLFRTCMTLEGDAEIEEAVQEAFLRMRAMAAES